MDPLDSLSASGILSHLAARFGPVEPLDRPTATSAAFAAGLERLEGFLRSAPSRSSARAHRPANAASAAAGMVAMGDAASATGSLLPTGPAMGGAEGEPLASRELAARVGARLRAVLADPLVPKEADDLAAVIDANPRCALQCGITPEQLPALVEACAVVAAAFIAAIGRAGPRAMLHAYLACLYPARSGCGGCVLSLRNLEVARSLAARAAAAQLDLPPDFLGLHLSHALSAADALGSGAGAAGESGPQARMVRLLCAYVTSLLADGSLVLGCPPGGASQLVAAEGDEGEEAAFSPLSVELVAFTVAHARVREAAVLFRTLKSMGC